MDASIIDRVISLAGEIQQVPAPTFSEQKRAQFIHQKFLDAGVDEVFTDGTGNVYARLRGQESLPPLVVSAHLDTVFPDDTNLSLTRTQNTLAGPGIGDNSLGLAGLFGLYWSLVESSAGTPAHPPLPGDLWLAANVCEEGLGNLKGMKAVVDRFGDQVLAYLVLEGMSLGQVYHQGLGVMRFRLAVNTRGGHSWVDYGNPSAIHELAELVVQLKNLSLPSEPRTSLNVGVISGGTSVNTIASDASLLLDLRSVSARVLAQTARKVQALTARMDRYGGDAINVNCELIGERPAGEIPADHPLVKLVSDCYSEYGIRTRLNIGSTDANVPLSRGIPAICIGLTHGGGTHTTREYIDIEPVSQGLEILTHIVRRIFEQRLHP